MSLGERLIKIRDDDFTNCYSFFQKFKIDNNALSGDQLPLIKAAHGIAFTMSLLSQKISGVPVWDEPFISQLRADTVQLVPSIVFGNKRTLHLYERAAIEDFLRYFYFFDHKIELMILKANPTKYQTTDTYLNWVKEYPLLEKFRDGVVRSCNNLSSVYSDLSRTIHGNVNIGELNVRANLSEAFKPIEDPAKELELLNKCFSNVFFLLACLHIDDFRSLTVDESKVICQHFSRQQKLDLTS